MREAQASETDLIRRLVQIGEPGGCIRHDAHLGDNRIGQFTRPRVKIQQRETRSIVDNRRQQKPAADRSGEKAKFTSQAVA